MKPRDLFIIAAVVLVAGFAAADAIRERTSGPTTAPTSASTPEGGSRAIRRPGPRPQADAPPNWPAGVLEGVLTFTDAATCRARVIGLPGGRERPTASFRGNCTLWAPPTGPRMAYGLGPPSADGFQPFRIANLQNPRQELGGYRALFGVVLWSPDGRRVAWCGRRRTGFDLDVGGDSRRLPACPVAYTSEGEIAYAIEDRLVVGDDTVLRAQGGITFARYGTDGSIAILEDGERLVRYDSQGRRGEPVTVPQGRTPILSPDNCAAVFRPPSRTGRISFVELGCYRGREPDVFGQQAVWSPDGTWIAVAEHDTIAFHRVVGVRRTVRWPAQAEALAWRP